MLYTQCLMHFHNTFLNLMIADKKKTNEDFEIVTLSDTPLLLKKNPGNNLPIMLGFCVELSTDTYQSLIVVNCDKRVHSLCQYRKESYFIPQERMTFDDASVVINNF